MDKLFELLEHYVTRDGSHDDLTEAVSMATKEWGETIKRIEALELYRNTASLKR